MKKHFGCPVQATSNVFAGKWKVLIIWHLSFGSLRFAEIRDLLPGISEKVLAAQLRDLELDGVVKRLPAGTVPPRVDYVLSSAGEELVPIMEAMCGWGTKHLGVLPNLPRGDLGKKRLTDGEERANMLSGGISRGEPDQAGRDRSPGG
jgi:DNA-binding HxlR family transcriptional regulator